MVAPNAERSITRRSKRLEVPRPRVYWPKPDSVEERALPKRLDERLNENPMYGCQRLKQAGEQVC